MARRTKEEAQETRALILDTAENVFLEKGVSRTSLAEIATGSGRAWMGTRGSNWSRRTVVVPIVIEI